MTPELDSSRELSALLVGPANRRGFRLADHEHRPTLGVTSMLSKPESAKSASYHQNARDVVRGEPAVAHWDEAAGSAPVPSKPADVRPLLWPALPEVLCG